MNSDNLTEQEYMPPSEVGSKLHVDKLSNSFTWVAVMYNQGKKDRLFYYLGDMLKYPPAIGFGSLSLTTFLVG